MGKIAIITLNGHYNFGNRLQNYALQEMLKSFGFQIETICINETLLTNQSLYNNQGIVKSVLLKSKNILSVKRRMILKRSIRLKIFSDIFLNEVKIDKNLEEQLACLDKDYNFFITGSDQVWNPFYNFSSSLYFLAFTQKEKRISYAPSFGISSIPDLYKSEYKEMLMGMTHLSVREEEGATIIKELTGRDAEVLVDPTLLLEKEKWLSIAKQAKQKPKTKYLLTYFLEEKDKDMMQWIKSYAKENNLKVINLLNINNSKYYYTDPCEFIDYISTASLFFTDSYHGCVFSIIFKTPFIVLNRNSNIGSMKSRIDTLLKIFNLESRTFDKVIKNKQFFNVDFKNIDKIQYKEQEKATRFLNKAMNTNTV